MDPKPVPDEAKELKLVNTVEMRIAMTTGEDKLEAILKTFLTALLLKLASPHSSVRNKVVSVCQHLTARIRPIKIQLPVEALLTQFNDPEAGAKFPLISSFDLVFLQIGIPRLSLEEKGKLAIPLLKGISQRTPLQQQILFNVFLKYILPTFKLPDRGSPEERLLRSDFGFEENPEDSEWLAEWLGKFLMFQGKNLLALPQIQDGTTKLPGLSAADVVFLTSGGKPDSFESAEQVVRLKLPAIKLIASSLFTDRERYVPSLCACFENSSDVMNAAEFALKQASSADILEDSAFIQKFYDLYLGVPERQQNPVHPSFQKRILLLLQKSVASVRDPHADSAESVILDGTRAALKLESKKEAIGFAGWVVRMSSMALVKRLWRELWDRLHEMVNASEEQGRPAIEVRKSAISLMGVLLIRLPAIWAELHFSPFKLLLKNYESDRQIDIAETIESTMLLALPKLLEHSLSADTDEDAFMATFTKRLRSYMDSNRERIIRDGKHIALRYSHTLLEFSNLTGRLMDLLVLQSPDASPRSTEEALRGLNPYHYRLDCSTMMPPERVAKGSELSRRFVFPDYESTVRFLSKELKASVDPNSRTIDGISIRVLPAFIAFIRSILFMTAIEKSNNVETIDITENWLNQLNLALGNDAAVRSAVTQYYRASVTDSDSSTEFVDALCQHYDFTLHGVITKATNDTMELAKSVLEIISLLPYGIVSSMIRRHQQDVYLKDLPFFDQHISLRHTNSRIFGIIVSYPYFEDEIIGSVLDKFLDSVGGDSKLGRSKAACLAHSYLISRLALQGRLDKIRNLYPKALESSLQSISQQLIDTTGTEDVKELLLAFGELCFSGAAKLIDGEKLKTILGRLTSLVTHDQLKSSAIQTIGLFSLLLDESSGELDSILETLLGLYDQKDITLQFSIAESLAVATGGYDCSFLHSRFDIDLPQTLVVSRRTTLPRVVSEVLTKARSPKPSLKRAACVWSLALLEYCGKLSEITSQLTEFHRVFRSNLSDREGFVQETASKGVTLVYELGDEELKDLLVRDLVAALTGEKQTTDIEVSADTQLFEEDVFKTGEGSINTYGDIMSLAAEVGDPSLIYKFMAVARHNSIWSTRAAFGGRYGFAKILSETDQNPKLYPKLFRYRFDPSPAVRKSMDEIWSSLVKDSNATIMKYFDLIMEDLLKTIVDREWRVRESSCMALSDLIQGKPLETYNKFLERLWSLAFKVVDDVKDSVRIAAMKLCKTLTKAMANAVNVDSGASQKQARIVLESLMPFLLGTYGIEAKAKEVQHFALDTLLTLIKKSGKNLLPFIPDLIPKLLGLLSTLEPEAVNYLHLNADKYNLTENKIDAVRLSSVRSSPMMEAIELCLDRIDEETIGEVISNLRTTIPKMVGMPSKVGSSRVIVRLVLRHMYHTKPHADNLLKTVMAVMEDRNDTVATSYAAAAGYLCRLASNKAVLNLVQMAEDLFVESEDEKLRLLSGSIIHGISLHAADRWSSLASSIMPFVYIAKRDSNKSIAENFEKSWSENGSSGSVRLYLPEILKLVEKYLPSQKWSVRQSAALALAEAVQNIGRDLSTQQAELLYPTFVRALEGKSWSGKENVLKGFSDLLVKSPAVLANKSNEVKKIVIREAKRQNAAYGVYAVEVLGSVAEKAGWWNDIHEILYTKIEDLQGDDDEMDIDIDSKNNNEFKLVRQKLYMKSLTSLARCAPSGSELKRLIPLFITRPPLTLKAHSEVEWQMDMLELLKILASKPTGNADDKEALKKVLGEFVEGGITNAIKESARKQLGEL